MVTQFGRPVPQLCLTTNRVMDYVFGKCSYLIAHLNQPWLSKDRSQKLENCWGFIDGTVRPLCMPNQNQKILYHGHKRVHGIKVQCAKWPYCKSVWSSRGQETRYWSVSRLRTSARIIVVLICTVLETAMRLWRPCVPFAFHLQGPFIGASLTPEE